MIPRSLPAGCADAGAVAHDARVRTLERMGCLIGCLALAFPRVALGLVWLFGGSYVPTAYPSWVWPAVGFVVLPLTTLAYAYASHSLSHDGTFTPLGWIVVGLAALVDLGLVGGGHRGARHHRARKRRAEVEDEAV